MHLCLHEDMSPETRPFSQPCRCVPPCMPSHHQLKHLSMQAQDQLSLWEMVGGTHSAWRPLGNLSQHCTPGTSLAASRESFCIQDISPACRHPSHRLACSVPSCKLALCQPPYILNSSMQHAFTSKKGCNLGCPLRLKGAAGRCSHLQSLQVAQNAVCLYKCHSEAWISMLSCGHANNAHS